MKTLANSAKGAGAKRGKKTLLTPEMIRAAAVLKKSGADNKALAAELGINESTLYDYQKKSPEFAKALKSGRTFACAVLEGRLYRRAHGYPTVQRRVKRAWDADTKRMRIIEDVKIYGELPPDATSLALFLNNNAPERYSRKAEDRNTQPAVVIFQFNVVGPDGKKSTVEWDPRKPPPQLPPRA